MVLFAFAGLIVGWFTAYWVIWNDFSRRSIFQLIAFDVLVFFAVLMVVKKT